MSPATEEARETEEIQEPPIPENPDPESPAEMSQDFLEDMSDLKVAHTGVLVADSDRLLVEKRKRDRSYREFADKLRDHYAKEVLEMGGDEGSEHDGDSGEEDGTDIRIRSPQNIHYHLERGGGGEKGKKKNGLSNLAKLGLVAAALGLGGGALGGGLALINYLLNRQTPPASQPGPDRDSQWRIGGGEWW